MLLSLVSGACATTGTVNQDADEGSETPGGECFWSIEEGGSECLVAIGIDVRLRSPGTTDVIEGSQGYGKKKWKCGEKREVCGTEVECTCPFPVKAPDGGS